jgi:uncharacterized repeat protein (TIGR01451 family)
MFARLAAITVVALAAGCSYNPGTFPWILPPGPIEQNHAKPRFGYFKNFDPRAAKIEVTPSGQANAPLNSQIVLVASVLDKDGTPRRSRRVEWTVEGPGHIVEVDESGAYAGRGYKLDSKTAVSYTVYTPKTITRGNDDPKDDVNIAAGQTFLVVSSAIPGETVVTAYAPEVFNWENNRVVTKVLWGDSRFSFPAPAVVRVGTETRLATGIDTSAESGANFRVRYRVIDGPTATLVSGGGAVSLSGSGGREAEVNADTGEAAIRLVQSDPKPGKTRVAVEVVKLPENGVGPGTVVGKRETIVEWAAPSIKLNVTAPPAAGTSGTFPVTVALDNIAGVDSKDARVRVTLSDGATLEKSEPPPTRVDRGALIFDLPPVSGKGKQAVTLDVRPARAGNVTITADAVTGDGLQANTSASTKIENGKLQLVLELPQAALANERIPARVAVTNAGAAPAENVTVWARFDDALTSSNGRSPVELSAGTLAPGQTKTLDLPLSATRTGRFGVRAAATGDGNLSASAEPAYLDVRRAELAVSATGPKIAYVGQQVEFALKVTNRGDTEMKNVSLRAAVPAELKVTAADGGTVGPGSVEWKLSALRPGESKAFKLNADALKLAGSAGLSVVALGDPEPLGVPVEGRADAALAIIGTPALALEVATPSGTLEVGKRATYQIRVRNSGTVSARNVQVVALAPAEFKVVRATGGAGEARTDANGRVSFPVVEEVAPGQTLTFTVEVDAAQAGDARFKAEVTATHLKNPLREEQSARVTGR